MLYVTRHAESALNSRDLLCGQIDVPLTEKGKRDTLILAEKLKSVKFDCIYCSPMIRTRQTLEGIMQDRLKDIPVVYDERLIERDFGYFEGENLSSGRSDMRWRTDLDHSEYKMESIQDFFQRVSLSLVEIKDNHGGQNVLVVCHAGVMRMVRCYFNGFPDGNDITSLGARNLELDTFAI